MFINTSFDDVIKLHLSITASDWTTRVFDFFFGGGGQALWLDANKTANL